jgi:hemerythrin-like domain-containing protein
MWRGLDVLLRSYFIGPESMVMDKRCRAFFALSGPFGSSFQSMKGGSMKPTEELKAEHEGIMVILDVLDRISEKIVAAADVPTEHLDQIIEFLQVFVDKCHHGKEEDILFPAMEEAGIPVADGPIGVMLSEHDRGRRFTGEMKTLLQSHRGGGAGSLVVFTTPALQYTDLLRSHMWKENNVLFPMADEKLSEEKQALISQEFDKLEREKIGVGRHEAFHAMIEDLSRVYL